MSKESSSFRVVLPTKSLGVLADCKLPFTRSNCCTAIKKETWKSWDFRAFQLRWGFSFIFFLSSSTDCSDAFQQIIICGFFGQAKKCQYFLKRNCKSPRKTKYEQWVKLGCWVGSSRVINYTFGSSRLHFLTSSRLHFLTLSRLHSLTSSKLNSAYTWFI